MATSIAEFSLFLMYHNTVCYNSYDCALVIGIYTSVVETANCVESPSQLDETVGCTTVLMNRQSWTVFDKLKTDKAAKAVMLLTAIREVRWSILHREYWYPQMSLCFC